jgi:hypothetical protein
MAELGTIKQTDVNAGTRPIDRTAELRALATGLGVGKDLIDKKVLSTVREGAEEILASSLEEAQKPGEVVVNTPDLDELAYAEKNERTDEPFDPEILEFAKQIRTAQAMAEQGRGSNLRHKAMQDIQRYQAQARAKYGWLSSDIDRLTTRIMSNDPNYLELGMLDTGRQTTSNARSAQVAALQKYSEELDIPPSATLGSAEWVKYYDERSPLAQATASWAIRNQAMIAEGTFDTLSMLEATADATSGKAALIEKFRWKVDNRLGELENIRRTGTPAEQARAIDNYQNTELPALRLEYKQHVRDFTGAFNELWKGTALASPQYPAALIYRDRALEDMATTMEMLEAGSLDVNTLRVIADIGTMSPDLLKTLDLVFNNSDIGQQLSNAVGVDVATVLGRRVENKISTEDLDTPEAIRSKLAYDTMISTHATGTPLENAQTSAGFVLVTAEVMRTQGSLRSNTEEVQNMALHLVSSVDQMQKDNKALKLADPKSNMDRDINASLDWFSSPEYTETILTADRTDPRWQAHAQTQADAFWGPDGLKPQDTYRNELIDAIREPGGILTEVGAPVISMFKVTTNDDMSVNIVPNESMIKERAKAANMGFVRTRPKGVYAGQLFDILDKYLLTPAQNISNTNSHNVIGAYELLGQTMEKDINRYLFARANQHLSERPNQKKLDTTKAWNEDGGKGSLLNWIFPNSVDPVSGQ